MKNKSLHTRIIFFSVLTIIFFGVYYYFYIQINKKGNTVLDLTNKISEETKKGQQLNSLVEYLDTVKTEIDTIDSYFVGPDGEVNFIEQIEGLAKKQDLSVEIKSVQVEKDATLSKNSMEYLTLKINISGSWVGTYKFLSLLESMPYKIIVSRVGLSNVSDKDSNKGGVWDGVYDIKVLKKS